MGIEYNGNDVKMSGIVNENEMGDLREHMTGVAPAPIAFDLTECQDIHTAVIQLINAYKSVYETNFSYGGESAFKKAIEGFVLCEN
jgi:hypothetical protein